MNPSTAPPPRLSDRIGALVPVPPLLAALREAATGLPAVADEQLAVRVLDALQPLRPDAEVVAATATAMPTNPTSSPASTARSAAGASSASASC